MNEEQKETISGNPAAIREVLEDVRDWLARANKGPLDALATSQCIPSARCVNNCAKGVIRDSEFHIERIGEVLSSPPRNCDRFSTWEEAFAEWEKRPWEIEDLICEDGTQFVRWLFAPETKEDGAP